ncbi:hypothetical protein RRG08_019597 [Elysia crispata]|uniref:Uncharacterized protein n=1 Tax=Elysia crispata TaxID=231223 RepID=A0AAE1AWQ5_9GAST|nr:hypothetical protein RRG08_019597 [Elysia crispata]
MSRGVNENIKLMFGAVFPKNWTEFNNQRFLETAQDTLPQLDFRPPDDVSQAVNFEFCSVKSTSHKTRDGQSGVQYLYLNKEDNFENETKNHTSDASTDEDWATTEVKITLSASISGSAPN